MRKTTRLARKRRAKFMRTRAEKEKSYFKTHVQKDWTKTRVTKANPHPGQ